MLRGVIFYTFGLKTSWLENYLANFHYIFDNELGPKQAKALISYAKEMELYKTREPTDFYFFIKSLYTSQKYTSQKWFWPFLWTNLYSNNALFQLWGLLDKGTYSRSDLLQFLLKIAKVHNRSVDSGLNSLISTFEYTPIGRDLKIGIVTREKNKRFVTKEGGYPFDPYVVLYALYKFAHKRNEFLIDIGQIENELFSPQKILVVDTKYVKKVLFEIDEPDLLKTDVEEDKLFVRLTQEVHPYEILKRFIQREKI